MMMNRLAFCVRSSLRTRTFANYNSLSISSFTRSFGSSTDAKCLENLENDAPHFNTSRKQSRNESDYLMQLRSNIRSLHGITESSEEVEFHENHLVEQSTKDDEFNYFEDGVDASKQLINVRDDVKRRETAFIENSFKPKSRNVHTEVTFYGRIRKDHRIENEADQTKYTRKSFREARSWHDRSGEVDETNSFSKRSARTEKRQVHSSLKDNSYNSTRDSVNLFDEQYFDLRPNNQENSKHLPEKEVLEHGSFIEEQYFSSKQPEDESTPDGSFEKFVSSKLPNHRSTSQDLSGSRPSASALEKKRFAIDAENLNYFDQNLLDNKLDIKATSKLHNTTKRDAKRSVRSKKDHKESSDEEKFALTNHEDEADDFDQLPPFSIDLDDLKAEGNDGRGKEEEEEYVDDNTTRIENFTRKEIKEIKSRRIDVEKAQTAYEAVTKLRVEKGILQDVEEGGRKMPSRPGMWDGQKDSKGFKILSSQTQDMQKLIDLDLVSMLCDSILFENEELLAINKPYGLPSQGGPGITKSIASLLKKMAARRERNIDTYHMVHRLDKETTGVMLLAKTEKTANLLSQMFLKRQVIKVYWAITKGIPSIPEGIIDIPIGEQSLGDKFRMNLAPEYNSNLKILNKHSELKDVSKAVTHYKVIHSNFDSALVECRPETGLKHQIRCHLAFGLNTPILGDHKYSHISKIAPQKLSLPTLERLGIRQAKVRHLAMHLHSKTLVLPEFLPDGRNLMVSSRLPPHFVQNMKWLKLRPNNK